LPGIGDMVRALEGSEPDLMRYWQGSWRLGCCSRRGREPHQATGRFVGPGPPPPGNGAGGVGRPRRSWGPSPHGDAGHRSGGLDKPPPWPASWWRPAWMHRPSIRWSGSGDQAVAVSSPFLRHSPFGGIHPSARDVAGRRSPSTPPLQPANGPQRNHQRQDGHCTHLIVKREEHSLHATVRIII